MVTLGDFDKKREENLINTLEVIKEVISKDDGTLKIIVSDLSKRLFLKMGEDGHLEKDTALVDLEQAKKVYLEKKKIEESPRILFIFSPIVHNCFGDEEMYNMAKFIEMIGENAQKVLVFDLKDGNHPEYGFNDISASLSFFAAKCNGASTFLNDTIDFRTRTIKGNFKLIDLIRYILGIYEIKNKQVIITTPEIYPKINNKELAFSLLDQHYKIMEKEQRFIDPRKFFSGFGAHRGDIKYLTSSFSKTSLDITKLENFGKTDLDTLAKWGMLTLDNEGLYHVNYETYGILPFILDFDTRLKYIYESIYQIFRFFKTPDAEDSRKYSIQRFIYNEFEHFNLTSVDIEKITFFVTKFNYIFSNYCYCYTENSLIAFKEFYDELVLMASSLEKSMSRVREK